MSMSNVFWACPHNSIMLLIHTEKFSDAHSVPNTVLRMKSWMVQSSQSLHSQGYNNLNPKYIYLYKKKWHVVYQLLIIPTNLVILISKSHIALKKISISGKWDQIKTSVWSQTLIECVYFLYDVNIKHKNIFLIKMFPFIVNINFLSSQATKNKFQTVYNVMQENNMMLIWKHLSDILKVE